jgi:colanic acid biosynthesis protein WcaH
MSNKISPIIPRPLYKKIHELMPIACVDVVIINNKKEFLLLKRKNKPAKDLLWFPGGRLYKHELLAEAAQRIVKEETGLNIEIIKCLGNDETIFPDGPFNNTTHTINTIFLAKIKSKYTGIRLDRQSEKFIWHSRINKNWSPYIKKFLELAGF